MAVTNSAGKLQNPFSTSISGGTVPAANVIVDVGSWADALEPRKTPILSRAKKLGAVEHMKHEWGQSYHRAITGTIGEALDNSETDLTFSSGEGKLIQPWHVIRVIDWVSGSTTRLDYSTAEEIVIKAHDGSDTSSVVQRGAGGTSAVSHSSGAYFEVIGVAMPYNTDFNLSPTVRGDRLYNYSQRFYGMAGADEIARHEPDYENKTDILLADLKEETMLQKFFLEQALVKGGRQVGDAANTTTTGSTSVPFKTGGIDYFITNHSGRVVNMGGATLSAYSLEDILADMYKEIDDGGAMTLMMSVNTSRIFDTLLNPIRQATVSDSSVNLVLDKIKFRWGTVDIQPTRHLDDGSILFVDFANIGYYPRKGGDWKTKQLSTDGPYDKTAIWGEFGVKVDKVTRMAKLWNFNTDLAAYPRNEYI